MHSLRAIRCSVAASLFITLIICYSPFNTTRGQLQKEDLPSATNCSLGKSVYHSHAITLTHQLQRSKAEVGALFIQGAHFNHLQTVKILHLAHEEVCEGSAANPQLSQSLTILQAEMTICVNSTTLGKAIPSNHHSLQLLQPIQLHLVHIPKAVVSDNQPLNSVKRPKSRQPMQSLYIPSAMYITSTLSGKERITDGVSIALSHVFSACLEIIRILFSHTLVGHTSLWITTQNERILSPTLVLTLDTSNLAKRKHRLHSSIE